MVSSEGIAVSRSSCLYKTRATSFASLSAQAEFLVEGTIVFPYLSQVTPTHRPWARIGAPSSHWTQRARRCGLTVLGALLPEGSSFQLFRAEFQTKASKLPSLSTLVL